MFVRPISVKMQALLCLTVGTVLVVYLLPYLWMVMSSFRAVDDPFASGIIPHSWTLENYVSLFKSAYFMRAFANSLKVALSVGFVVMMLATPAAYAFSRFGFRGRGALLNFLMVVPSFPGVLLAIALFVQMVRMGLYNTYVPLILANSLMTLPFAVWNLLNVFDSTPVDFEESAQVEGCSRLQSMIHILLPIILPGLASTFAFVCILTWNEYMFATTFIGYAEKRLITTAMGSNVGQYNVDYNLLIPSAVLASFPLLALFASIQRYIISGLQVGGVKG